MLWENLFIIITGDICCSSFWIPTWLSYVVQLLLLWLVVLILASLWLYKLCVSKENSRVIHLKYAWFSMSWLLILVFQCVEIITVRTIPFYLTHFVCFLWQHGYSGEACCCGEGDGQDWFQRSSDPSASQVLGWSESAHHEEREGSGKRRRCPHPSRVRKGSQETALMILVDLFYQISLLPSLLSLDLLFSMTILF